MEHYENLVFQGGSTATIGYVGDLKALEYFDLLKNFKRFAGTSAGAIFAGLLAVGYIPRELQILAMNLNLAAFKDTSVSYVGPLINFGRKLGFYEGLVLYDWLGEAFRMKTGDPDITFAEVYEKYGKELIITGTKLSKKHNRELHLYQRSTNPTMPIRAAIRISAGLPGLFKPFIWDNDLLVDGGLAENFPLWVFDSEFDSRNGLVVRPEPKDLNEKTLGIRINSYGNSKETKKKNEPNESWTAEEYLTTVIRSLMQAGFDHYEYNEIYMNQCISADNIYELDPSKINVDKETISKLIDYRFKNAWTWIYEKRHHARMLNLLNTLLCDDDSETE